MKKYKGKLEKYAQKRRTRFKALPQTHETGFNSQKLKVRNAESRGSGHCLRRVAHVATEKGCCILSSLLKMPRDELRFFVDVSEFSTAFLRTSGSGFCG